MFRSYKPAQKYFRKLRESKELGLEFDGWYLSLMVGLADGTAHQPSSAETTDMVEGFPEAYKQCRFLILTSLLDRHLATVGIDLTKRELLDQEINSIVDSSSPGGLTSKGYELINQYSYGGYEKLVNSPGLEKPPHRLSDFLPLYHELVQNLTAGVD